MLFLQDDDTVALWDIATGKALCGNSSSNSQGGTATCIAFASHRDDVYVTAGCNTLRLWKYNNRTRKSEPCDAVLRGLRREYTSLAIASDDSVVYAGACRGIV